LGQPTAAETKLGRLAEQQLRDVAVGGRDLPELVEKSSMARSGRETSLHLLEAASSGRDEPPTSAPAPDRAAATGPGAGRRRRVRLGLLQLGYLAAAAIVGALLPWIQVGSVPADKVSQMLFAIAAACCRWWRS
jgi:hypothetical protein